MPKNVGKGYERYNRPVLQNDNSSDWKGNFGERTSLDNIACQLRKVSFKPTRGYKNRFTNAFTRIKEHFADDIEMSGSGKKQMYSRGGGGRERWMRCEKYRPLPHESDDEFVRKQGKLISNSMAWYNVIIPYGHKYKKEYIVQVLSDNITPETFIPIMYKVEDNFASFYVDDFKIADKLSSCSRKITAEDGFKLILKVKPALPISDINQQTKERIKLAMAKRFVEATNALDLSQFHRDPDLRDDIFCALSRTNILVTVLEIVAEHTPSLEALNLDNNKLRTVEMLGSILFRKLPSLKILHIGNNQIRLLRDIDSLRKLKLQELYLKGNPLCDKYNKRQSDYINDVRSRFPKLLKLDGELLPVSISFDVEDEDEIKLPPTQRTFTINNEARQIATTFLQQYFTIFDSEDRQPLLNAYNEDAFFSLTISVPYAGVNRFSAYLPVNRNLFRVNDSEKRNRLLKRGRLPIVTLISEFPKTQHYLNTFTMDLGVVTETMMNVTVTGLFKELSTETKALRYFDLTFIIVPQGSGYCIRNEQLHIMDPSKAQERQLDKILSSFTAVEDKEQTVQRERMTLELMQKTGMNLEWSHKCLSEVQWNFETALQTFKQFHEQGLVPSQAFVVSS
ncbi:nuclear RNA export factor 1 [Orussus abietinus]|uniref:nuclear RNA export factor 1 n=1 Tax=Orussus abietinus TaxID=222816 RepID=UPI0006261F7F|nr:nuclear RNA export factor 1 [Orussus abietinus]